MYSSKTRRKRTDAVAWRSVGREFKIAGLIEDELRRVVDHLKPEGEEEGR